MNIFLHVDLDAFFASVEQLDHPEWRGKPVIVGSLPTDRRGVVSTASYEARRFGVHSAMPIFQAVRLCPQGIFVRGRMKRYHEKSEEVMAIFKEYSPDIQQISVDEAFIDLTGTERLFGNPVETAKRLKAEVKEKTGLTVSVGLSSTKYCAKIASGLQKPDGLTVVPFGSETDFMLSLPLEKVWGAGKKTLSKLESYGIKTTRDIYNRSEKLLQSLFGNAMGSFLYNSVRGNESADFRAEVKSRSISAENTYEYDLTDRDAIETAILSLCNTVMFRSLREKVRSSTVSLKIRYEDFTTVSVQATSERYVSSVDDLYERTKALFEKKYDSRLSIRLLGVCLQNLEDENTPLQRELFDFGEEKKRKLESAILKAQEKNPGLKITKARLLGMTMILLSLLTLFPKKAVAEEKEADGAAGIVFDTSKLPLSDSGNFISLFNRNFGEQNVEFFAEGYWKSTVTGGAACSFGFGLSPTLSTSTPVFAQNVDLSLYFMLNHHWYFEAAFADEFSENTVGAGYIGDGYLKHGRLSNRKIIFPSIYSVDEVNRGIGGGENQAPGLMLKWAGEKWRADTVLRYDMLEAHEKTWYGKNSVSIKEIALSEYNTGNQYILPSQALIQSVKAVYVESAKGDYKDTKGRKYKKLDESQYLLLSGEYQLLLSKDAKAYKQSGVLPAVAVTFYNSVTQSDFGSYDDDSTFLGKLQKWFSSMSNSGCPIRNYSYSFFNSIDGEDCLFLQHPSGFSPFAVASRYDCLSSNASDAQIASSSTLTADSSYSVVIDEENYKFASTDFFYSNHLYADVSLNDDEVTDEIEKLIHASFPLASENPQIYLGGISSKLLDKKLQVRTFTPVNRFEIGTDAVSGSVTVYKNGVIDPTAQFDSESGTITLSGAVSASDHITARWYEESEDSESGALSLAAGFKYDFTEKISGDISASGRWSYSPEREYADASYSSNGFASVASKISYEGENLRAKNTIASTYENSNTTGIYRILGNDESDTGTYYLAKSAEIDLPGDFAPVINEKSSATRNSIELKSEKNGSVEAGSGKTDSEISGYAIPFEWDFSGITAGSDENQAWSALSIKTPGLSGTLSNAGYFSIAIRNPLYSENFDTSSVCLYLQLGVSGDDDFSFEDSERLPTWKISDSSETNIKTAFDFSSEIWQTVTVILSDEDRASLASIQNFNARLILTTSDTSALPERGRIYIGPYEAGEITFLTSINSNSEITVTNYEEIDTGLSASVVKKFNSSSSKNTAQHFEWTFEDTKSESEITFTRYFSEADLSLYKKLSFFLRGENVDSIKVTLSRPENYRSESDNGSASLKTAVCYTIPSLSAEWTEYTVDLTERADEKLTRVDTNVVPTKLEFTVTTSDDGFFSFDELYLSENTPYVVLQDKMEASYRIDGVIFGTENFEILKDFTVKGCTNAANSIETENGSSKENSLSSTGALCFTFINLKIKTEATLSNAYKNARDGETAQKNALGGASHSLETEKPVLNSLSFSESYAFSAEEESLEKSNTAKIDFSSYNFPLEISGSTKASSDSWSLNQNAKANLNFKPKKLKLTGEAAVSQKILTDSASSSSEKEKFGTENYFYSYSEITRFSFDTGDKEAQKRSVSGKTSLSYSFDYLKLTPQIFFETEGNYKSSSKISFTDTSKTGFDIPFSVQKNNFSFSYKKSGGSTNKSSVEKGGSYERDILELQKSLSEKTYFFTASPIYDLVSKNLSKKIFETDRDSNYYTGSYSFNWKRAFFASKYDFFIPQSAKIEATRDIRTGDSTADFYQIKNTVNYTALNIFGKNGTIPVFSFFSKDEYASSLTATLKIPRASPSSLSYILSGYLQATFYFTQTNYLKNGFEGSYEGENDWKAKYTLVCKREGKSSLARGLVSIFSEEFAKNTKKITKTDSLNASASQSSGTTKVTKKYSLAYTHGTETQVTKYVSLNTEAGLSYYANWGKIATLTATATIGATVKF